MFLQTNNIGELNQIGGNSDLFMVETVIHSIGLPRFLFSNYEKTIHGLL